MSHKKRIPCSTTLRVFVAVCLLCLSSVYAEIPAFPGAEGFGQNAVGGRGGAVYHVTTLNDTGPGSFRDAVSRPNRTVVFDVAGVIPIKSRISVADHVTIAGQTAPGDGVVVYGNGLSFSGADHAIVRYMRFRMGIEGDKGKDAITIAEGSPMIFDHVSVSWGRDETFSISGEDGLFTIQNAIIAQGLDTHSCGGLLQNWGGISVLRTLYIDNHTRNPKVKGVNQFVNNVVYNWRVAGYILGDSSVVSHANVMANYYIAGPQTPDKSPFSRGNENFNIYAVDNVFDANKNGLLDGKTLQRPDYGVVTWLAAPNDFPVIQTVYEPRIAYKRIVSQAGACLPARDQVDQFLVTQLTSLGKEGKVISNENQNPVKGPGSLQSGQSPKDTDQDGMPDLWENAMAGLDASTPDNNGDIDNNDYTNLEDYLNWLAVPHAIAAKNTNRKIDLRTCTAGFNPDAVYTIDAVTHGTATMAPGQSIVMFQPETDFTGLSEVSFTVNDGDKMSDKVVILITNN